jgi:acyl carrier protein
MTIEEQLRDFIVSEVVAEGKDREIGPGDPLIATGLIDSMGLLQVLGFVQQRFGVDLLGTGDPEDFQSIQSLAAAVRRVRGES